MSNGLKDKVVVVTGASSGIGDAAAVAFAREGAAVALGARRADRIEEIAGRITADGGRAIAVPTDVTDEAQANALIDRAAEELGSVDVLVNNAGVMLLGPAAGADTSRWRRMIEVNLLGLLYCTHAALRVMGAQGSGHIINVSSMAGRRANPFSAVYNMTKFGVHGFSEGLRQEVLHAGVRVSVIAPGFVDTELVTHNDQFVIDRAKEMKEQVGEILTAEDVARAIVFVAGQPAHVDIAEFAVVPSGQA